MGSTPTPLTVTWARGPTGRRQPGVLAMPVRLRPGPLKRKVAGYGSPGRFAKPCGRQVVRVQIPCLPPFLPRWCNGDHASLRTRALRVPILVGGNPAATRPAAGGRPGRLGNGFYSDSRCQLHRERSLGTESVGSFNEELLLRRRGSVRHPLRPGRDDLTLPVQGG